jgi:hypothetical protein
VAAQDARYASGDQVALALRKESIRSYTSTYPAADLLVKLEAGLPLDAEGSRRREDLWRELRG